jgi:hypothetical protein
MLFFGCFEEGRHSTEGPGPLGQMPDRVWSLRYRTLRQNVPDALANSDILSASGYRSVALLPINHTDNGFGRLAENLHS